MAIKHLHSPQNSQGSISSILLIIAVVLALIIYLISFRSLQGKQQLANITEQEDALDTNITSELTTEIEDQNKGTQINKDNETSSSNKQLFKKVVPAGYSATTFAEMLDLDANLPIPDDSLLEIEAVHPPNVAPLPTEELEANENLTPDDFGMGNDVKKAIESGAYNSSNTTRTKPVPYISTIIDSMEGAPPGGAYPLDAHGAAGPDHLISFNNNWVQIISREPGSDPIAPVSLGSFFLGFQLLQATLTLR